MTKIMGKSETNGIPIRDALERFISQREIQMIVADDPSYSSDMSEIYKTNAAKLPDDVKEPFLGLMNSIGSITKLGKLNSIKVGLLAAKLRKGKLNAFGYPVHEKLVDQRVIVPQFLLHEKYIKSVLSEISGLDRRYVDVVIARQRKILIPLEAIEVEREKPKIGRPSIQENLAIVIQKLVDQNAINPAMPVKAIGEVIRDRGKVLFPEQFVVKDGKVKPGRSTIEKAYNKYLSK